MSQNDIRYVAGSETLASLSTDSKGQPSHITMAEVQSHNRKEDCWIVIDGIAYNVTNFMFDHPGGMDILLNNGGKDCTDAFEDIGHTNDAKQLLVPLRVGYVEGGSTRRRSSDSGGAGSAPSSKKGNSSGALSAPIKLIIGALLILVVFFLLGVI